MDNSKTLCEDQHVRAVQARERLTEGDSHAEIALSKNGNGIDSKQIDLSKTTNGIERKTRDAEKTVHERAVTNKLVKISSHEDDDKRRTKRANELARIQRLVAKINEIAS